MIEQLSVTYKKREQGMSIIVFRLYIALSDQTDDDVFGRIRRVPEKEQHSRSKSAVVPILE